MDLKTLKAELNKKKVVELKDECDKYGLNKTGKERFCFVFALCSFFSLLTCKLPQEKSWIWLFVWQKK